MDVSALVAVGDVVTTVGSSALARALEAKVGADWLTKYGRAWTTTQ